MTHPKFSISTDFRCQYPHGYAVCYCVRISYVLPSGSMWLDHSLLWSLNLSLDACEHLIALLFLCPHLTTLYTNTQATWIRKHNALFRAPQRSTRLRQRSHVIGSRVMYVIMLIKRFRNATYVWLCKTVLELCLQFKLTVSDVAVFLVV